MNKYFIRYFECSGPFPFRVDVYKTTLLGAKRIAIGFGLTEEDARDKALRDVANINPYKEQTINL